MHQHFICRVHLFANPHLVSLLGGMMEENRNGVPIFFGQFSSYFGGTVLMEVQHLKRSRGTRCDAAVSMRGSTVMCTAPSWLLLDKILVQSAAVLFWEKATRLLSSAFLVCFHRCCMLRLFPFYLPTSPSLCMGKQYPHFPRPSLPKPRDYFLYAQDFSRFLTHVWFVLVRNAAIMFFWHV